MGRPTVLSLALCLVTQAAAWGCVGLGQEYQYEEQITLGVDGSATVTINASVAALVAFHQLPLDLDPDAPLDRDAIGRLFEAPGVRVRHVSRPWERHGRQYVQVQVEADRVEWLPRAHPFSWADYSFERRAEQRVFRHTITGAGEPVPAGWTGRELFAVRVNVPSRIEFHNAPSGEVERGNLLVWEQPLPQRLRGEPLAIEIVMQPDSIFLQTLSVFLAASAVGMGALAMAAWWFRQRGRRDVSAGSPAPPR